MTLVSLAVLAALLGLAAWLAHTLSGTPLVGYDDANVYFVYARNLLDGQGFVFNAGGERVEGFTSLLWLLVCTAAAAITPRFEILLVAINVAIVSAALWWLHRFIAESAFGKAPARQALSFLLVAAVALSPGFVVWNVVSLMDSGLWTAVFVMTAVAALRSARILPLLLVVLVLTRPESLLLAPVMIAISFSTRAAVAFGVAAVAVTIWRIGYFGYPLPNTYYATAGEPILQRLAAGFDYFSDFAMANPLVPLALIAGVITTARAPSRAQAGLLALMVTGFVIPIVEGGDRFGFWRMYQPLILLAAIQAAFTASAFAATAAPPRALAACAVAVVLALVPWRHWVVLDDLEYAAPVMAKGIWYTPKVEISIADDMRRIGAAFNEVFPDVKPAVGVIVAGGFAFTYAGPTIDLMGHNHVAMAHSPGPRAGPRAEMAFDHGVFNAVAPDAVLLSRWSPERDWFALPMVSGDYDQPAHLLPNYFPKRATSMRLFDYGVLKGLLLRSKAGERYAWASVRPRPPRPGGARWIHAIFKREFLKRLESQGYEIVFATVNGSEVPKVP